MSLNTISAIPLDSEKPITDKDYCDGIEFLRLNCAAFRRHEQELKQMIIDNLSASNCMAEAAKADIVSVVKTMTHLSRIQDINREVINKVRAM